MVRKMESMREGSIGKCWRTEKHNGKSKVKQLPLLLLEEQKNNIWIIRIKTSSGKVHYCFSRLGEEPHNAGVCTS